MVNVKKTTGRPISIWFTHREIEVLDAVVKQRRLEHPTFSRSGLVHELVGERLFTEESLNLVELLKTPEFQDLAKEMKSKGVPEAFTELIEKMLPKELIEGAVAVLEDHSTDGK